MRIEIAKGAREDRIAITRADGSCAETRFPKKGPLPHDAVHFFVEQELGLKKGFWGMIAAGHHPEALDELAKAAGHASAARAAVPDAAIVELLQAERLVECFEADLWGGAGDDASFLSIAATACAASHVPLPPLDATGVGAVRAVIAAFAAEWIAATEGHTVLFTWKD